MAAAAGPATGPAARRPAGPGIAPIITVGGTATKIKINGEELEIPAVSISPASAGDGKNWIRAHEAMEEPNPVVKAIFAGLGEELVNIAVKGKDGELRHFHVLSSRLPTGIEIAQEAANLAENAEPPSSWLKMGDVCFPSRKLVPSENISENPYLLFVQAICGRIGHVLEFRARPGDQARPGPEGYDYICHVGQPNEPLTMGEKTVVDRRWPFRINKMPAVIREENGELPLDPVTAKILWMMGVSWLKVSGQHGTFYVLNASQFFPLIAKLLDVHE